MKRSSSHRTHPDEKSKSSHSEDRDRSSRPRTEEEKRRRRREWLIQQEREREHERLKRKMIMEYELKRAREQASKHLKRRTRTHSKSKSKSPEKRHRRASLSSSYKPTVMSEKRETSGTALLFKGPEGTQISTTELRRIKVDIYRNLSTKAPTTELQRDIVNPEDVVLKRREEDSSPE